jgi:hypothetical protein
MSLLLTHQHGPGADQTVPNPVKTMNENEGLPSSKRSGARVPKSAKVPHSFNEPNSSFGDWKETSLRKQKKLPSTNLPLPHIKSFFLLQFLFPSLKSPLKIPSNWSPKLGLYIYFFSLEFLFILFVSLFFLLPFKGRKNRWAYKANTLVGSLSDYMPSFRRCAQHHYIFPSVPFFSFKINFFYYGRLSTISQRAE